MIAVFSLAERVVPPARVGAAMTMLASATGLGYALGSSLAGRRADASGATAAFGVTVGATVLAVALMSTQQRRLRAASGVEQPAPPASTEPRVATTVGGSR
jgi:predicted MFS family arabinose efflux permease